ncbi:MAG: Maf family protein [Acidobacteriota bacterium]
MRLVLASASPRRAELLTAAGFAFDAVAPQVDERALPGELPDDHVGRLAQAKAAAVASQYPQRAVVGADTVVVIDGLILGKPESDEVAVGMLRRLSGRSHDVLTGLCVRHADRIRLAVERSTVTFAPITIREIRAYVASGEPRDKAGAYAIQGVASRFVVAVTGSYSNVVGLPVATLYGLLRELGLTGGASPHQAV